MLSQRRRNVPPGHCTLHERVNGAPYPAQHWGAAGPHFIVGHAVGSQPGQPESTVASEGAAAASASTFASASAVGASFVAPSVGGAASKGISACFARDAAALVARGERVARQVQAARIERDGEREALVIDERELPARDDASAILVRRLAVVGVDVDAETNEVALSSAPSGSSSTAIETPRSRMGAQSVVVSRTTVTWVGARHASELTTHTTGLATKRASHLPSVRSTVLRVIGAAPTSREYAGEGAARSFHLDHCTSARVARSPTKFGTRAQTTRESLICSPSGRESTPKDKREFLRG